MPIGAHRAAGQSPAPEAQKMTWWQDARFGMFIHWGPVTLTGQELSWSRANSNPKCPNNGGTPVEVYDNLYKSFYPSQFDANKWIDAADEGGMKYMVFTAKHCDGFLLWHSKTSDYDMGSTPYKKDICAELAKAAHDRNMRLGWYFSPPDWRDPDFRTDHNGAFVGRMQTELTELLSNYGRIDDLWFDWDCGDPAYDQSNTYRIVRTLQPQALINNRLDLGPKNNNRQLLSPYANYCTPEQEVGAYDDQKPWESCMTLGTQWSWKPNDDIKSAADVERALATCAGGDGNLLLDVGPMPTGQIEPREVTVLKSVGDWLKLRGASIYGTRGGPYKPGLNYVSTRNGSTVYVHVLKWSGDSVSLPTLPMHIIKAKILGGSDAKFTQSDSGVSLSVPVGAQEPGDTVIALTLDASAMSLSPISAEYRVGSASASEVFQNDPSYGPDKAFDGASGSRWATENDAKTYWLRWDYKTPTVIQGVNIVEAYPSRVTSFSIQYLPPSSNTWITLASGTRLGADYHCSFSAVNARAVRLNIFGATDGPTISEMSMQTSN